MGLKTKVGQAVPPVFFLFLSLQSVATLQAQDLRNVTSPDGQLEFRLFVGQPEDSGLSRLAYQVIYKGKRIVDTSYLGLDISLQEPLLGQYIGLTGTQITKSPTCNELTAHYMQNGSLGRLLDIEARACNGKIEFRYVVPKSTPLLAPFVVDDEKTEFAIEPDAAKLVSITESASANYPPMQLTKGPGNIPQTRLTRAFETNTPFTTPWRIITIGESQSAPRPAAAAQMLTNSPWAKTIRSEESGLESLSRTGSFGSNAAGDRSYPAEHASPHLPDAAGRLPNATLTPGKLPPQNAEFVALTADKRTLLFAFPRFDPARKTIVFTVILNGLTVTTKFEPKKMLDNGLLAL